MGLCAEGDGERCLLCAWIFMPCLCIFACQVKPPASLRPSSCVIPISLLIALIQRALLLLLVVLLLLSHSARATRRMRNISAYAFRFAFQVCLPLHTSWLKKWGKVRGKQWTRCVKNFLFMLTFHLNVSLFVCQFEVLKSRWLKRAQKGWLVGEVFDCNLCWVCEKEMSERRSCASALAAW